MIETMLKFHLIISAICFVVYLIGIKAIYIRFKNKYELINIKRNRAEFIIEFIRLVIMMLMPLINITLAYIIVFMYDKVYDAVESKFIASGMAKLKTDTVK